MDYIVKYEYINFQVNYTYDPERPEGIIFAAQPFELLDVVEENNKASRFLLYGRLDYTEVMEIGFQGFSFVITDELHERLGKLYKAIRAELSVRYNDGKME